LRAPEPPEMEQTHDAQLLVVQILRDLQARFDPLARLLEVGVVALERERAQIDLGPSFVASEPDLARDREAAEELLRRLLGFARDGVMDPELAAPGGLALPRSGLLRDLERLLELLFRLAIAPELRHQHAELAVPALELRAHAARFRELDRLAIAGE